MFVNRLSALTFVLRVNSPGGKCCVGTDRTVGLGVIPIHQRADQDLYYQTEQFKGWFEELNSQNFISTIMPTYLEHWGCFTSTIQKDTAQDTLPGQRTAQELADEWAGFLTVYHAV